VIHRRRELDGETTQRRRRRVREEGDDVDVGQVDDG
jgi:hypothetical protein